MITNNLILEKLKNVLDPELGISIVDLGLVYNVEVRGPDVEILMTLTTIGCPLFGTIQEMIEAEVRRIKGVGQLQINLTFDPPWGPERMSPDAQTALGFS